MKIVNAALIAVSIGTWCSQSFAQGLFAGPPDLSAYAKANDLAAVQTQANKRCQQIYANSGTTTVGNNSTARVSMLPAALTGGSLTIPAGALQPGGKLHIVGYGIISASTVGSPNFTFTPNITPNGGSKTDLPGFSASPLIGVVGITWLDMQVLQTPTGLLTGGIVSYAQANSANNYPNPINNARSEVASDYTVVRTFGVDGAWSVANASNYVTVQVVTIDLCPPGA